MKSKTNPGAIHRQNVIHGHDTTLATHKTLTCMLQKAQIKNAPKDKDITPYIYFNFRKAQI